MFFFFVGVFFFFFFFFQAEDGIRDRDVTGVQTCALPISRLDAARQRGARKDDDHRVTARWRRGGQGPPGERSEEHTSELQSHHDLVCRLLPEKKKYTSASRAVPAIPRSAQASLRCSPARQ